MLRSMAASNLDIRFSNENRGSQFGQLQGNQYNYFSNPAHQQPVTPDPLWMVPRNVSTVFTGRTDVLEKLEEALLPSKPKDQRGSIQKRYVLCGLGGIGKSEVCLKFANNVREKFRGIFWVDVSSPAIAEKTFIEIARNCGQPKQDLLGVKYVLANIEKDWLLILDNADDRNLNYAEYFPSGDRGAILITTRNYECEVHQTVGYRNLDILEPDASISLLFNVMGTPEPSRKFQEEAARAVTAVLGSHTLAIVQAGAYIKGGYCQLKDYPMEFLSERADLLKFGLQQAKSTYGDVFTTFEVSAKALQSSQEPGAADAMALLQILAFLHYENVPIFEILEKALKHAKRICNRTSRNLDEQVEDPSTMSLNDDLLNLSTWHSSRLQSFLSLSAQEGNDFALRRALRRALNLLASFSLIRVNNAAGLSTISMHSLAHAWAAVRMTADEQEHAWEVAGVILGLSIENLGDYELLWTPLQPHLHSYLDHLLQRSTQEQLTFPMAQILYRFSWVFDYLDDKRLKDAVNILQRMKEACITTAFDLLCIDDMTACNDVRLGHHEAALTLLEKTVESAHEVLNSERRRWFDDVHRTLARTYQETGQTKRAIEILEQTLATKRRTLPPENSDRLIVEHDLAVAFLLDGQSERAVELLENVVAIKNKTLAIEHPERLVPQYVLARAYLALGGEGVRRAVELLENVVTIRSKTLAATDRDRLASEHELARAYLHVGGENVHRAVGLLENVVAVENKTMAATDRDRLASQQVLARAYLDSGNSSAQRAVDLLEEVVAVSRRTLDAQDPNRLASEGALAEAYVRTKQASKAIEILEQEVATKDKILATEDSSRLDSQWWLAGAYIEVGRYKEAVEILEEVVAIDSKRFNAEHRTLLDSQALLGKAYKGLGRSEQGVGLLEHVVIILRRKLDAEHPMRQTCGRWLEEAKAHSSSDTEERSTLDSSNFALTDDRPGTEDASE